MHHCIRYLWFALLLLLILCAGVSGEQASQAEMVNVARNWVTEMTLRTGGWAGESNAALSAEHQIIENGQFLGSYYDVSPRGFVVVPVLKEMPPVLLYSDESNLDESQSGGLLQLVKDVLLSRTRAFSAVYGDVGAVQPAAGEVLFDRSQRSGWARLEVEPRSFRAAGAQEVLAEGGPLLTSSWHQRAPYNNDCPVFDGTRCAVGCSATSLSQILDFWQWPASGIGYSAYSWTDQLLMANYSDPYDWANIVDSCDGAEGCTAEQQAALAELCSEAGISLRMYYGASGSSAPVLGLPLVQHFKYRGSLRREVRSLHSQQSWFDLMKYEVDSGRVSWYVIHSHAIVCDGYRDNAGQLEFHMNYGWGGIATAWYVLDNLYCPWILPDSICPYAGENTFVGIEPEQRPGLQTDYVEVDDSPGDGDGLAEPGETIRLTPHLVNAGHDAVGTVGTLTTSDPFAFIADGNVTFTAEIPWGERGIAQAPVSIAIAAGCPTPYLVACTLALACDGGYSASTPLHILVGDRAGYEDDFEAGTGAWTSREISKGLVNEWHLETNRSHSGSTSWKYGGPGQDTYSPRGYGGLVTPPILLPADARMTFWHWYDAMTYAGNSWDGGLVLIREDDGAWTQIAPIEGYPSTIAPTAYGVLETWTPCYSGAQDWTQDVFDLSAFSGVVQFMFQFGAGEYDDFHEGWYIDDFWVGNTLAGTDVSVNPASGMVVTFDEVSGAGTTTVTVSASGEAPPSGFTPIPAAPAKYHRLETSAVFSGAVEVCLTYSDTDGFGDEAELTVLAWDGDTWVDVTTGADPANNKICASVEPPVTFLLVEKTGCCEGRVGDANGDGSDEPTIGDVSVIIDAKLITGTCDGLLECLAEADVNLSGGSDPTCDDISIGDITVLIDYLFITGSSLGLADCP